MHLPPFPIQTARLHLRPFGGEDLADLYAFHRQPGAARLFEWEVRTLAESQG